MIRATIDLQAQNLLRKLRRLPTEIQDKVIIKSVRDGANLVKNEARRNAPTDTGQLKSRIKAIKARKSSSLGSFVFLIKGTAPHSHLIELGTDERKSTRGKKLVFTGRNGNDIYVHQVAGVTPVPFLGNAYEAKKDEVLRRFRQRLERELNKI